MFSSLDDKWRNASKGNNASLSTAVKLILLAAGMINNHDGRAAFAFGNWYANLVAMHGAWCTTPRHAWCTTPRLVDIPGDTTPRLMRHNFNYLSRGLRYGVAARNSMELGKHFLRKTKHKKRPIYSFFIKKINFFFFHLKDQFLNLSSKRPIFFFIKKTNFFFLY